MGICRQLRRLPVVQRKRVPLVFEHEAVMVRDGAGEYRARAVEQPRILR